MPEAAKRRHPSAAITAGSPRLARILPVAAAALWLPQAGMAARVIGNLAENRTALGENALLAGGFLLVGLAAAALNAMAGRVAFRAARGELSRHRRTALEALGRRSPVDIGRPASGHAASVLAEQAEMIVPWLSRYLPARTKAVVMPFLIAAAIFPFSWLAAVALLLVAPVIPLFMALVGMGAQRASERQLSRMGDINAFLIDRLRGLATIRTLGAVDDTAKRLRREALDLKRRTMSVLKIAFLTSATLEFFSALGVAMIAVYIGFHLLGFITIGTWGARLSLAQGLFVLMIAPAFFEPLRELSAVWHDRAAGEAALKALETLSEKGAPLPDATAVPSGGDDAAISVETIAYAHPGRAETVFDGFSLTVEAGERIAIVAPSGAGKSTLLSLLAGLAAPQVGRIAIFGASPVQARSAAEIAWIGQSTHVFAGSIAANVSLGRPAVKEPEIAGALATARLTDVTERHGRAPLGEGGNGLSGGELVRLAVARAAADAGARLILADEPPAPLDAQTATLVTESLLDLARGRTLLVVTHDPALAARMDRIVELPAKGAA